MINKYEERLGTERMLPLVFKMALPAVAAQFVNLLYSMVDRIYIGHIPGNGADLCRNCCVLLVMCFVGFWGILFLLV